MALLRRVTPPWIEIEEDKLEAAQLHANEIRDEDESAGAKYVLNLDGGKARSMRTFRRREGPWKGN